LHYILHGNNYLKKLTWIEPVVKNPAALLDARKIKYTWKKKKKKFYWTEIVTSVIPQFNKITEHRP
jgi:hypothetical protein